MDNVDKTPAKVPHSGDESMCAISVCNQANHLVICGIHVLSTNGTLVERCSTSLVSLVSMMLLKRRLCFCGWCRCKASKWVCLAGVKSIFRTNNCSALFSSWISSGSWMPFTSSSMIPCLQAERSERSDKGPGNSRDSLSRRVLCRFGHNRTRCRAADADSEYSGLVAQPMTSLAEHGLDGFAMFCLLATALGRSR